MKVYSIEVDIYHEDDVKPTTITLNLVSSLDKAKGVVDKNLAEDKEANTHAVTMYYVICFELDGKQLEFSDKEAEKYDLEADIANYRMLLGQYKGEF